MTFCRRVAAPFFLLLATFCLDAIPVEAQTSKAHDDRTVEALINEVRLLRETLQRINLNAYRSQIIIERMRMQNDQVMRSTRLLESIRDDIADTQVSISRLNERAKAMQARIDEEGDSKQRSQLEVEQQAIKYGLDQEKQRLERLRERESRLTIELQTDQEKLRDLEGRLDAMEQEIVNEIERQRSASEEKTPKKAP